MMGISIIWHTMLIYIPSQPHRIPNLPLTPSDASFLRPAVPPTVPSILKRVGPDRRKAYILYNEMAHNEFVEWWLQTDYGTRSKINWDSNHLSDVWSTLIRLHIMWMAHQRLCVNDAARSLSILIRKSRTAREGIQATAYRQWQGIWRLQAAYDRIAGGRVKYLSSYKRGYVLQKDRIKIPILNFT